MRATSSQMVVFFASAAFWVALTGGIALTGQRWRRLRAFRARMLAQWRTALVIAALYALGAGIARGPDAGLLFGAVIGAVPVFCQAILGLAIARGIAKFDPLPATTAVTRRSHIACTLVISLALALVAVPVGLLLGSIGSTIGQQVFGEHVTHQNLVSQMPSNPVTLFLYFLAGAGIAEETLYRLVILSLVWRLTGLRWVAVVIAALVFAAYHLSPLDSFYLTFWQYPVSQFLSTALIGLVWGWLYVKRGYETAVLGHTLSDWLPVLLFLR
jgi:membrane protease YdiL (CAAX protease family)